MPGAIVFAGCAKLPVGDTALRRPAGARRRPGLLGVAPPRQDHNSKRFVLREAGTKSYRPANPRLHSFSTKNRSRSLRRSETLGLMIGKELPLSDTPDESQRMVGPEALEVVEGSRETDHQDPLLTRQQTAQRGLIGQEQIAEPFAVSR